ncbi:hypothetical protein M0R45_037009 [Rubus argutus]|uniref:Phorbol-ester/DAG-type domain-containing protein n=1 Tax=Rubus argutus TaxID=59490 RepID=A0AAW1VZ47_RUBAR
MYHCHICKSELFINRYYYTCDKCKFHLDPKCASNWSNKHCIEHFSHKHLLFLGEISKERDYGCAMCGDRVFGLNYRCSHPSPWTVHGCDFFLHKSCAELPRKIGPHPLHRRHPLVLKNTGKLKRRPICSACKNGCRDNYIYSCSECGFGLDVKCASKWISRSLQHFSHEHPLMFKQIDDKEKEEYTGPPLVCDGCQDPVFGPSYTCPSRKCCFNLHKSCAELPSEIQHPAHGQHPLFLLNTIQNVKVASFCNACNIVCRYRYNCSICDFNLHLKCASNWRKVFDCREHQFAIPRKEMALNCDICGEYKSGTGCYVCSICQLLVHKECASLPRFSKIPAHQHSLKLTWFLEDIYPRKDHICKLCSTNIDDKCRAVL